MSRVLYASDVPCRTLNPVAPRRPKRNAPRVEASSSLLIHLHYSRVPECGEHLLFCVYRCWGRSNARPRASISEGRYLRRFQAIVPRGTLSRVALLRRAGGVFHVEHWKFLRVRVAALGKGLSIRDRDQHIGQVSRHVNRKRGMKRHGCCPGWVAPDSADRVRVVVKRTATIDRSPST